MKEFPQELSKKKVVLPNEILFVAKASSVTKFIFYLIVFALVSWFNVSLVQEYQSSTENFFVLLFQRISDWRILLTALILAMFFLNLHARSIIFHESYFVYKRWYWKNNYYNYPDISKIIYDYKSENNGIILELKTGKKIKIPLTLLRDSNEYIGGKLGTDLVKFLREMTNYSVKVE